MVYLVQEVTLAEWKAFCAARPDVHLFQTATWAGVRTFFHQTARWFLVYNSAYPVAGAQVFTLSKWGNSIQYVPGGPLWAAENTANSLLLQAIVHKARANGSLCVRIEPNYTLQEDFSDRQELLAIEKFQAAQRIVPTASVYVDLSSLEQQLYHGFARKHKRSIQRALKQQVVIQAMTDPVQLSIFYAILQETSKRNGNFNIFPLSYYQHVWHKIAEQAEGKRLLLIANYQGTPVATVLILAIADRCYALYGGATITGLQCCASHLLQWEAIRWAKAQNCKIYDFFGVPQACLQGNDDSTMVGLYHYKMGFGGYPVAYVNAYDYLIKRLHYYLWQKRLAMKG